MIDATNWTGSIDMNTSSFGITIPFDDFLPMSSLNTTLSAQRMWRSRWGWPLRRKVPEGLNSWKTGRCVSVAVLAGAAAMRVLPTGSGMVKMAEGGTRWTQSFTRGEQRSGGETCGEGEGERNTDAGQAGQLGERRVSQQEVSGLTQCADGRGER